MSSQNVMPALRRCKWLRAIGIPCSVVIVIGILPFVISLGAYVHGLLTLTFVFMAGALAWNWLGGFAGQVSFGSAAMFGVGGFTAVRVMMLGYVPFWASWIVGGLAAAAFSIVWGHAALRLRGPYFAIATLGVTIATEIVATFWSAFTGGASGLSLPLSGGGPTQYDLYWYALALVVITAVCSYLLRNSRFGLALVAIREDVEAAADTGVNAPLYQDVTLLLSSFIIGIAGALYGSYNGYLVPSDMFGFSRSVEFVLMAVVGGLGTTIGPMLGAFVFIILDQLLLSNFPNISLGLYGLLLIFIILFEPLGIWGLGARLRMMVRGARGETEKCEHHEREHISS